MVTHKQDRIPNINLVLLAPPLPPVKLTQLVRRRWIRKVEHAFGVEVREETLRSVGVIPEETGRVGEEGFRLIAV